MLHELRVAICLDFVFVLDLLGLLQQANKKMPWLFLEKAINLNMGMLLNWIEIVLGSKTYPVSIGSFLSGCRLCSRFFRSLSISYDPIDVFYFQLTLLM